MGVHVLLGSFVDGRFTVMSSELVSFDVCWAPRGDIAQILPNKQRGWHSALRLRRNVQNSTGGSRQEYKAGITAADFPFHDTNPFSLDPAGMANEHAFNRFSGKIETGKRAIGHDVSGREEGAYQSASGLYATGKGGTRGFELVLPAGDRLGAKEHGGGVPCALWQVEDRAQPDDGFGADGGGGYIDDIDCPPQPAAHVSSPLLLADDKIIVGVRLAVVMLKIGFLDQTAPIDSRRCQRMRAPNRTLQAIFQRTRLVSTNGGGLGSADSATLVEPLTRLKQLLETDDGEAADFLVEILPSLSGVLKSTEIKFLARIGRRFQFRGSSQMPFGYRRSLCSD